MYYYDEETAGWVVVFVCVMVLVIIFGWLVDTSLAKPFEVTEEVAYTGFDEDFFIVTIDKDGGEHKLIVTHQEYKDIGDEVTLVGKVGKSGKRYEVEIK